MKINAMGNNLVGSLNDDKLEHKQHDAQVIVNTMQRTPFVERLPNSYTSNRVNGIVMYDKDNLYPNKAKSIAQRSSSTKGAIKTLSSFMRGSGFQDEFNKFVVNSDEQTLWDILRHICGEKATFQGYALHFNFNRFGQIIEVNEIPFENIRHDREPGKLISNVDWKKNDRKFRVEYDVFNPEKAAEQIAEIGIENYNGQVFYWIPNKKELYTLCQFDDVLDDAQFEAESKLYKLSNIQNGFSGGYIIKYPSALDSQQEIKDLKNDIKSSRGAKNAGKTKAIPMNTFDGMGNFKMIEPIPRNDSDKKFLEQNKEAKTNIYNAFAQPPILNGIDSTGMFNQDSYTDAFNYYNNQTETERKDIERVLNRVLSFSIWNLPELEILPKTFIVQNDAGNKEIEPTEPIKKEEEKEDVSK